MLEGSLLTPELKQRLLAWRPEPMTFDVEKGAILRYAEVVGDANFLWTEEACVADDKHGGLVAMPMFLTYFNPFHWGLSFPHTGIPIAASAADEFEFYRPVRPGDRIMTTERFVDAYEKGSRRGPLLFTIDERTYTNQNGEMVGKSHWTRVLWRQPVEVGNAGSRAFPEPPARFHEYVRQRPLDFAVEATAPPRRQISFGDVDAETEIPSSVVHLSHEMFVRYAACNREYARHHVDFVYAAAVGWRDCICQGVLGTCFLGKLLTDWIGAGRTLRRLKGEYRGPGYPGDTWTCRGRVTKKYTGDGENHVDCDVWIENQDGAVVTQGRATVALPS